MANNGQQRNREGGYRSPDRTGSTRAGHDRAPSSGRSRGTISSRNMEHGRVSSSRNERHDNFFEEDYDSRPSRSTGRGAGSTRRNAGHDAGSPTRNPERTTNSSRRGTGRGGSSSPSRNGGRGTTQRRNAPGPSSGRRKPKNKFSRIFQGGPLGIALVLLAVVVLIFLAVFLIKSFLCKGTVTIEAGESYSISDFLKQDNPDASFASNSDAVDTNVPGKYKLIIKNGIFTHKCTLEVKDTIAPQGTANDMSTVLGKELEASAFVTDIVDVTPVTVSYAVKPDFTQEGSQSVELVLEDSSKNKTTLTATLTLMRDTEAPVITGVRDITHSIGSGISYKANVNVTDNLDPDVELEVNTDGVDLNTEGTYQVTYSATDFSGNSTSQAATVTVIRSNHTEEEIMGIANDILAEITTEDMTPYDKASAIYDWVRGHVGYASTSSEAWTDAAYEGMVQGRGDCWAYTSASRALLTAAGIENMVIRKIPSDTTHAWNLVDLGEGWYHFDTTPRASHNERFFMWTDAQLMDYSNAYGLTHNYDKAQYPNIN